MALPAAQQGTSGKSGEVAANAVAAPAQGHTRVTPCRASAGGPTRPILNLSKSRADESAEAGVAQDFQHLKGVAFAPQATIQSSRAPRPRAGVPLLCLVASRRSGVPDQVQGDGVRRWQLSPHFPPLISQMADTASGRSAHDPIANDERIEQTGRMNTRKLRARDAVLPMSAMIATFVAFIYFGHADMGWLIGMSVAVIGLIGSMYRDTYANIRFYLFIIIVLLFHVAIIFAAFHTWKSIPVKAISPLFYLDFIAMALLLPKVTGIRFDETG